MIKFREPVAYRGIGEKNDGIIVKVEDALAYAMERCGLVHTDGGTEDDRNEFDKYIVDWIYQRKQEKVQQRMAVREAQRREEMEMERRRVDIVRHMRDRV